jgi:AAHS family 4-hydroxybenzoate transporter-like MFS transporter
MADDAAQLFDGRPIGRYQVGVLLLCSLVIFLDGYDLQAMALAVPSLAGEWGVAPSTFGIALAAALVGIGLGGAFVAPLGDRFGRRPVLVAATFLVGATTLATTFAEGPLGLAVARFSTGLVLGACQGNATAMTAEFAPLRSRAFVITLIGCNVALGSLAAGLAAPWVVAAFGWRGLFYIGGILPMLLSLVLLARLPESIQLLIAKRPGDPRIAGIYMRIFPGEVVPPLPPARADAPRVKAGSVIDLLRAPLRTRTLVLWLIYSANTFLLYLVLSWLPTLLAAAGWAGPDAMRGIVSFQVGGIAGSVALAWLVDRGHIVPALAGGYAMTGIAALLFAVLAPGFWAWTALFVAMGAGVSGAMFAIFALAAGFYPAQLRATGYGWAAAVGRLGAVLGPLAGGWVLAIGIAPADIMALLAVPALACALLVIPVQRVVRSLP